MSSASDPSPPPEVPRPADPAGLDPAISIAGPAAAPPGWWARNWKWVVLLVTIAPCAVCGLCGFGSFGVLSVTSSYARRMDAYQIALDTVRGSEDLQQVIGQPIEEVDSVMAAQGRLSKTDEGMIVAAVKFVVEGPKGRAKVTAQAHTRSLDDDWRLDQLKAEPVGHQPIVIVQTQEQERARRLGTEPSP